MPTLRVMFFGLICHVGTDPQKQQADHAVFVNAEGHEPCLVWSDEANVQHQVSLQLKGRDIYIGSLSTKPLPFSKTFQKYVPKLPDLIPSKKTVRASVVAREEDDDVHAYLRYPMEADELTVAQLYPKTGLHRTCHDVPLRRGCVARLTITKLETHGSCVDIGFVQDDRWISIATVPSDGCILFSNAENSKSEITPTATPQLAPNHVQHYSQITRDRVEVVAVNKDWHKVDVGPFPGRCSWVEGYLHDRRMYAAETVECGNSSEP